MGTYIRGLDKPKVEKPLSNEFFKLLYSEIWQPREMPTSRDPNSSKMIIMKAKGKDEYMLPNDLHFKSDPELDLISKNTQKATHCFLMHSKRPGSSCQTLIGLTVHLPTNASEKIIFPYSVISGINGKCK